MNYMKCTMKLMLIILLIKHLCHLMKKFFPEKPKDWNIPEKYLEDANHMFDKITN